jgi:hypothetical protein
MHHLTPKKHPTSKTEIIRKRWGKMKSSKDQTEASDKSSSDTPDDERDLDYRPGQKKGSSSAKKIKSVKNKRKFAIKSEKECHPPVSSCPSSAAKSNHSRKRVKWSVPSVQTSPTEKRIQKHTSNSENNLISDAQRIVDDETEIPSEAIKTWNENYAFNEHDVVWVFYPPKKLLYPVRC